MTRSTPYSRPRLRLFFDSIRTEVGRGAVTTTDRPVKTPTAAVLVDGTQPPRKLTATTTTVPYIKRMHCCIMGLKTAASWDRKLLHHGTKKLNCAHHTKIHAARLTDTAI